MHVYIIEEWDNGRPTGIVKVGKADSPDGRLATLSTGNPRELRIHSYFKCGPYAEEIEGLAQEALAQFRRKGEWFAVEPEHAKQCVEEIINRHPKASPAALAEAERKAAASARPSSSSIDVDEVYSRIHAVVIERLFRKTENGVAQVILWDDAAMALGYGSQRLPNGLNFVVPDGDEGVDALMTAAIEEIKHRLVDLDHDTELKVREENKPSHDRWVIEWFNPSQKRSSVSTTIAFQRVPREIFNAYASEVRTSVRNSSVMKVSRAATMASPKSLWSDTIVKMACAYHVDWSDVYDLCHISSVLRGAKSAPSSVELADALHTSAGIKGRTIQFVRDRLNTMLENGDFDAVRQYGGKAQLRLQGRGSAWGIEDGRLFPGVAFVRAEIEQVIEIIDHRLTAKFNRGRVKRQEFNYEGVLRELPDFFTGGDLRRLCRVNTRAAEDICQHWVSGGYVRRLDLGKGIFVNLYHAPSKEQLLQGLSEASPEPMIIVGAYALAHHGWVRRLPAVYEVAVPVDESDVDFPSLPGIEFIPRNREWFRIVKGHHDPGWGPLPILDPAFALVDALVTEPLTQRCCTAWKPDPDDIERSSETTSGRFRNRVLRAADAFGASREVVDDYLKEIESGHQFRM